LFLPVKVIEPNKKATVRSLIRNSYKYESPYGGVAVALWKVSLKYAIIEAETNTLQETM